MSDGIVDTQPDIESPLAAIRWRLADALKDSPWPVHVSAIDAIDGPGFVLVSGAMEPLSFRCQYMSHPAIICVAGRIEPGAGVDALNAQLAWAIPRLPYDLARVDDEQMMTFGGVAYLTQRIVMNTPVNLESPAPNARSFGTFGGA